MAEMEEKMAKDKKMVEAITSREVDFAQWYTDIVKKEEYWNSMVEKLFNDFNERMTSEIYQNLNAFIKNKDIEPTYY